jgi:hypothetical protein
MPNDDVDDDDKDDGNISILYLLFTCLLNCRKVNYEISKIEDGKKLTRTEK